MISSLVNAHYLKRYLFAHVMIRQVSFIFHFIVQQYEEFISDVLFVK